MLNTISTPANAAFTAIFGAGRKAAPAAAPDVRLVPATARDADTVCAMFGALHRYNASLDPHFALADDWESLLRREFAETTGSPNHLWLLAMVDGRPAGLIIAAIHTDSPMFRHRQWAEVEALYVDDAHRGMRLAQRLLDQVYAWAAAKGLFRVQLYVTACNERAQSVYTRQGFTITQAIMRKSL